ncbi:S-layer homology domain-containing protein [Tumebacillus sp. DT12]|uniref:S-layer homology domain-containing protein n=1 Tax=Tumebacillus lacus TaxID=2995335 RepID=A0ABT3X0Y9_9BACL|nr:S-layer homology domain-containing protein [Tumebacillus lacus]MCX7570575.1 S-layer homology domain-containing protein [Tumebacillus lacus]
MKSVKRWTALALTAALLPIGGIAHAADNATLQQSRDNAMNYMHQELSKNQFRYVLDWPALAIYAAGEDVTGPKWSTLDGKNGVKWRESDLLKQVNIGDATTDFESTLLGALAAHQNPRAFGKKDLIQAILSSQQENGKFADTIYGWGEDLLNAHVYGIIALYAAGQPIPKQELAASYLLGKQHADGGFNWSSDAMSDPDITAMALIAMKALDLDASHPNVQKAQNYLKNIQKDNGGFVALGVENSDTSSIIIEALLMHSIDPASWDKSGGDPVDNLLTYQTAGGSFSHVRGQTASNLMATQNAATALSGLLTGKSVYQRLHEQNDGKSWSSAFPDLPYSHPYYAEVTKLVNLGVLNGRTDGTFSPEDRVTREQFAKILVLGAGQGDAVGPRTSQFRDLDYNGWANPYVKLAFDQKWIVGTSADTFAPTGQLTGAQIMTVLVRMLGLESAAKAYETQSGQGWPAGHMHVAKAQGLYYPNLAAHQPATRAEVGYAFVRYYEAAMKQVAN